MTTKTPYQLIKDGVAGELITWDAAGAAAAVAVGTSGQVLTSNGVGVAPTFQVAAGGGNVTKVGTPLDNQIGVWTGDGTIEGDVALTFDTVTNSLGLGGTTSGSTQLVSAATASGILTLPAATDTLIGKATTDTLTNKTFDANGTGNSLSNVDVADLANGTDGELITWSAAGAPTTVAVGTSGQVLTSNGAGTAPTFQAAGGGGGVWTYGTEVALSGSNPVLLSGLPSGVNEVEILIIGASISAGGIQALGAQIGDSGGYETSGYTGFASDGGSVPVLFVGASTSGGGDVNNVFMKLGLQDSGTNDWGCSSTASRAGLPIQAYISTKSLSGVLTQVRMDNEGSTFDAGVAIARYR